MIETADIPNWTRWHAKEKRGVNRGYTQAYLNTSRSDHFVCLLTRDSEFDDTFEVTVKCGTDGGWKSGGNTHETFEGHESNSQSLLAAAEESARDWMRDHLCSRDGPRDSVELLTDLFNSLQDEGITPHHDVTVKGMSKPGHMDSTSHDIRAFDHNEQEDTLTGSANPNDADVLSFGISVDGKESGVSYREYTERDSDGETRTLHDPTNQEILHSEFESAFNELGFPTVHIENGGHQTYWDYATRYTIKVFVPENLNLSLSAPEKTTTSFF